MIGFFTAVILAGIRMRLSPRATAHEEPGSLPTQLFPVHALRIRAAARLQFRFSLLLYFPFYPIRHPQPHRTGVQPITARRAALNALVSEAVVSHMYGGL